MAKPSRQEEDVQGKMIPYGRGGGMGPKRKPKYEIMKVTG